MKFHSLKIGKLEALTPLSKKITFDIPENLRGLYSFHSGQYVSLELHIGENMIKRSYSICSPSANNATISVGVKQIQDGYGSKYLNQDLALGQSINVSEPEGTFIIENLDQGANYVFVAGGSGITPILSILYDILPKVQSTVHLKYSTLFREETMFYDEIMALKEKYPNFQLDLLYTHGENVLNENNLAEWLQSLKIQKPIVYVCGPGGIISATEHACDKIGLPKTQFHREYFAAKAAEDMQSASVGSADEGPLEPGEKAKVEIKYEGKKLSFECKFNETILDAALNAGGDPPYSCLVAACSTCRAMIKKGKIEMKDRDALSDKDIAKGFVLTCQSMPRSKHVVLDYDE
jgi:ring-1,2-phenylacetyl-CoA epoxidase subunit PaaE